MKRTLIILLVLFAACQQVHSQPKNMFSPDSKDNYNVYLKMAQGEIYGYNKKEMVQKVEKFVASDDKYNLSIDYKNENTGEMILRGYCYRDCPLTCVLRGFAKVKIVFKITISPQEGSSWCIWKFEKLKVEFKGGSGDDLRYISTETLEKMRDEMEFISYNGDSFEINSEFFSRYESLHDKIKECDDAINGGKLKGKEKRMTYKRKHDYTIEKSVYENGVLYCLEYFLAIFNIKTY